MADNPFYIQPPNILQALLAGGGAYQQGQDRQRDERNELSKLLMLKEDRAFRQQQATQQQANSDRDYNLRKQAVDNRTDSLPNQVEQRKAAAARLGITQDHPAYNSFVLTGKMPREDQAPLTATDKKAILDADESVLANRTAINALDEAKKISPEANSGWGASFRATLGNNLPDWMVHNALSSPKSSEATANYENIVIGQALAQLKSTFGAAPTEGERKILLELQASVSKPDSVRQDILNRAQKLAQKRLEFNEQRAQELRGGTFYKNKPSGGAQGGAPVKITDKAQRDALQPGTQYIAPDGSLRTKN